MSAFGGEALDPTAVVPTIRSDGLTGRQLAQSDVRDLEKVPNPVNQPRNRSHFRDLLELSGKTILHLRSLRNGQTKSSRDVRPVAHQRRQIRLSYPVDDDKCQRADGSSCARSCNKAALAKPITGGQSVQLNLALLIAANDDEGSPPDNHERTQLGSLLDHDLALVVGATDHRLSKRLPFGFGQRGEQRSAVQDAQWRCVLLRCQSLLRLQSHSRSFEWWRESQSGGVGVAIDEIEDLILSGGRN